MDTIEVGQVWKAEAEGDTPPILCFVGQIDVFSTTEDDMHVVSIVVVPHPVAQEAGWPVVSHMPVHEAAFRDASLTYVKDGAEIGTHFQEGYARWRAKLDSGEAGAFHVAPSEAYVGVVSITRDHAEM